METLEILANDDDDDRFVSCFRFLFTVENIMVKHTHMKLVLFVLGISSTIIARILLTVDIYYVHTPIARLIYSKQF